MLQKTAKSLKLLDFSGGGSIIVSKYVYKLKIKS